MTAIGSLNKAPFPWFGGKSRAAPLVWKLLGDVEHYVEPFAGALGVLLGRPHPVNRTYFSETVNDLDGFIVNAWRSIAFSPEETATHASWPVSEADKQARQLACLQWRTDVMLDRLAADPEFHDPKIAGWWLYGVSCHIGAFTGDGAWTADPVTGRLVKAPRGRPEDRDEDGIRRSRPQLANDGRGTTLATLREPGVFNDREPGVDRSRPHLHDDGQGVNKPQQREPGITRSLPQLGGDGQGVARPLLREPGITRSRAHLANSGQGVAKPQLKVHGIEGDGGEYDDDEFIPIVMPEMLRWFRWLSARLRHVRIINGDWTRVCTGGAIRTISVRQDGHAGIFLDPPYDLSVRASNIYAHDADGISEAVNKWALENGDNPDYRIVVAGFDVEHANLEEHGWSVHEWFSTGFLTGGMGNIAGAGATQMHRDRLWASPACLDPVTEASLFDGMDLDFGGAS